MAQVLLENESNNITGIELLIKRYRRVFRISENLDFYSKEDFKSAERKFVKWALSVGDAQRVN